MRMTNGITGGRAVAMVKVAFVILMVVMVMGAVVIVML